MIRYRKDDRRVKEDIGVTNGADNVEIPKISTVAELTTTKKVRSIFAGDRHFSVDLQRWRPLIGIINCKPFHELV